MHPQGPSSAHSAASASVAMGPLRCSPRALSLCRAQVRYSASAVCAANSISRTADASGSPVTASSHVLHARTIWHRVANRQRAVLPCFTTPHGCCLFMPQHGHFAPSSISAIRSPAHGRSTCAHAPPLCSGIAHRSNVPCARAQLRPARYTASCNSTTRGTIVLQSHRRASLKCNQCTLRAGDTREWLSFLWHAQQRTMAHEPRSALERP